MITMASLNIKKIIKITLCITLLLCITSCKSKDKNTNTPNKIDVSEKLDEILHQIHMITLNLAKILSMNY